MKKILVTLLLVGSVVSGMAYAAQSCCAQKAPCCAQPASCCK